METSAARPTLAHIGARTFPGTLARYGEFAALDVAPRTARSYRRSLVNFLADTGTDPFDATTDEIVSYLASLAAQGSGRTEMLKALKHAHGWALGRVTEHDPTAPLKLRRPKLRPVAKLPLEQERELLRALFRREPRRGWTAMLILATGGRIGSIVRVTVADVDLERAELHFTHTKNDRPYTVPLGRRGLVAARQLCSMRNPSERLVGVCEERVRQWLRQAQSEAGLPRVWPHLLRHSFATDVSRRTDPETWRRLMNHADLSQWPRYVGGDNGRMREAVR
jgi:site-specific recombinase XerD